MSKEMRKYIVKMTFDLDFSPEIVRVPEGTIFTESVRAIFDTKVAWCGKAIPICFLESHLIANPQLFKKIEEGEKDNAEK